jgi:phosphatidylglycerophosphate synthase
MAIDNAFRSILPRYAGPLIRLYGRLGLTPNQLSVMGCALGLMAAACVAADLVWGALLLWWAGRLVDGTDGIFARDTGQASDFGAYLDIVLDMTAYSAMILGFAVASPELLDRWLLILLLYVLCITSALALGTEEAKRDLPERDDRGLRLGAGLAEGGETGIAYTLFLLFPAQLPVLAAVWIGVLLTTVVARTVLARRILAG